MTIRDYHPADLPYLYDICLRTGDSGADASGLFSDPALLGQYYAAPYAVRDSRLVLVLETAGLPVGYVLGTDDTAGYDAWLASFWLPALRLMYPEPSASEHSASEHPVAEHSALSEAERGLRSRFAEEPETSPWSAEYPGHLHIDIMPSAQGHGWGAKLMDAFRTRLASLGCPAFHLGVSRGNAGALRFYQRYGMREIGGDADTLFLGMSCP